MKLYEVTNGWTGESYVRCLVVADSSETAIEQARPKFEARGQFFKAPDYAADLKAECLCEDVTLTWSGEVTDG